MTLLDTARAHTVTRSPDPRIYVAIAKAPKKLRGEAVELVAAALAREVAYATAARVLSDALGVKITDESIRKHGARVVEELAT